MQGECNRIFQWGMVSKSPRMGHKLCYIHVIHFRIFHSILKFLSQCLSVKSNSLVVFSGCLTSWVYRGNPEKKKKGALMQLLNSLLTGGKYSYTKTVICHLTQTIPHQIQHILQNFLFSKICQKGRIPPNYANYEMESPGL